MDVIYIDELFLLNLIIDYLIVLVSARVCGVRLRRWRYFFAAVLGAGYSAAMFFPGAELLASPGLKLACGVLMALTAFLGVEKPIRCAVVFFAVSAAFGGAVWAFSLLSGGGMLPLSMPALLVSFALCYGVVSLVFRRSLKKADREILTVAAVFGGRSAVFRALRDTGNGLYDPMTGCEVLIISPKAASALLPPGCGEILRRFDPITALEKLNSFPELRGRLRLVPYSAVGVSGGLLPLFRPDALTVEGREQPDVMIAVSPNVAGENEYEAVL